MSPFQKHDNQAVDQPRTGTAPGSTITVNAGFPGNLKKLVLEGSNWTVKDVLRYAEINHSGFDIRVGGKPAQLDSPVADGQTILLVRPVVGN